MENREIKVRAWHELNKEMVYPKVAKLSSGDILNRFSPEWIMEYTNLTDKNGKEIYEGDIIKASTKILETLQVHTGYVQFGKSSFVLHYKIWNGKILIRRLSAYANFEIVGNVYENPDLID